MVTTTPAPFPHQLSLADLCQTASTMCTCLMIKYTCECVKPMEFVQCEYAIASGQNIKCRPITKQLGKFFTSYCPGHLVYPDAARKYFSDAPPE
ncbi:hypothetical protein BFJ68_g3177 [Fusarium oxysporum]|uniref:Uncharacterized protein n=1 Tax=Fusarium oxysporum TaxID=5507 RepID=A0A420PNR7_FUSOX|nr:hypothetical protein BFJ71_g9091 [Fusarium oxysporum]RKL19698.1 hypothetical protein BFJ68_g3177 [Fusarium oxysporum]